MNDRKKSLNEIDYKNLCEQESDIIKKISDLQKELSIILEKKSSYENESKIDEVFDKLLRKKFPALGETKTMIDANKGIVEITFPKDVSKVLVKKLLSSYLSDFTINETPDKRLSFIKRLSLTFKLSERDICIKKLEIEENNSKNSPSLRL